MLELITNYDNTVDCSYTKMADPCDYQKITLYHLRCWYNLKTALLQKSNDLIEMRVLLTQNDCMGTKDSLLYYKCRSTTFFTRVNKNILHFDTYQFEVELSKQKTAFTVVSGVQFNFNAPNNVMSVGHFDSYSISSLK